jgi:hypothetical protein
MRIQEAQAAWRQHAGMHAANGIVMDGVDHYLTDAERRDYTIAMDAQPGLVTTANSAIPALFTTSVSPQVFKILLAPNMGAKILGERKQGDWTEDTAVFPTIERTFLVSAYNDFSNAGRAGANANWPARQSFLFQIIKEFGDREIDRAGAAKLNWVATVDEAAADGLAKFLNLTYHYGVAGLQNYGLFNEPSLTAYLTPALKAAGGTKWLTAANAPNATANEVFSDIQTIYIQLIAQSNGMVDKATPLKLVLSPESEAAFLSTNSYGINVADLLKKNFPSLTIVTDPLYGAQTTSNPQGIAGGNLVQLIAETVGGQEAGFCAFNEKQRSHPIVRDVSSYKQKVTAGSYGAVIRQPFAIAQMLGV